MPIHLHANACKASMLSGTFSLRKPVSSAAELDSESKKPIS